MQNPKFHDLLRKMAETHDKKNHDYAKSGSPYSNFEDAAAFAGVDPETVFLTMLGIKVARIVSLKKSGREPNNEPIQDSRLDLAVYAALYASYFMPSAIEVEKVGPGVDVPKLAPTIPLGSKGAQQLVAAMIGKNR